MFTGSCLCKKIQYQYTGNIDDVIYCHCIECRKAQGTPFASNAPLDETLFTITQGKHYLKGYESSVGKFRYFCSECGSPLFSRLNTMPNVVRLRLGTLDQPLYRTTPKHHIFVAEKADWHAINDDSPQFDTWAK